MEPSPQPVIPGLKLAIEIIHKVNSRVAEDDNIPFRERTAIDRMLRILTEALEKEIKNAKPRQASE